MFELKFHPFGVVLLALLFVGVWSCSSRSGISHGVVTTQQPVRDCLYSCGLCGDPIDVILVFNNVLKEPFFNFNVTISNKPRRELIYFLQRAGDKEVKARFVSKYWGSLGYTIESINGVRASFEEETYWQILEHTSGNSLSLGVSSYIPIDQEIIQFNFTTYGDY